MLDAPTPASGIAQLQQQDLQILSFQYIGPFHCLEILKLGRYGRVSEHDLITLFRQLALMIRSGNTLLQGLQSAAVVTQRIALRRMLTRIIADIQGGSSISLALNHQGDRLPVLVPRLVAFAEASGELEVTFEQLADNIERRVSRRRQFRSSIFYPSVVISVAIAVGLFLAVVIIPRFKPLLENRATDLPETTVMLIELSDWLVSYGVYVAIALAVAVFLVLAAYRTRAGKSVIDHFLIAMPVVGTSIRHAEMAQMGWTMSLLMRAGITVQ